MKDLSIIHLYNSHYKTSNKIKLYKNRIFLNKIHLLKSKILQIYNKINKTLHIKIKKYQVFNFLIEIRKFNLILFKKFLIYSLNLNKNTEKTFKICSTIYKNKI